MKLFRPGAGGDIHDSAGVASVFGAIGGVVNLELRNGVDRRLESDLVLHHVI